jgi:hypothetical protein
MVTSSELGGVWGGVMKMLLDFMQFAPAMSYMIVTPLCYFARHLKLQRQYGISQ